MDFQTQPLPPPFVRQVKSGNRDGVADLCIVRTRVVPRRGCDRERRGCQRRASASALLPGQQGHWSITLGEIGSRLLSGEHSHAAEYGLAINKDWAGIFPSPYIMPWLHWKFFQVHT